MIHAEPSPLHRVVSSAIEDMRTLPTFPGHTHDQLVISLDQPMTMESHPDQGSSM